MSFYQGLAHAAIYGVVLYVVVWACYAGLFYP